MEEPISSASSCQATVLPAGPSPPWQPVPPLNVAHQRTKEASAGVDWAQRGVYISHLILGHWDEQRFQLVKELMPARHCGGEVVLYLDRMTGQMVVAKRMPTHRLWGPAQATMEGDPWQEFAVAQYLGSPGPQCLDGVCMHYGSFLNASGDGFLVTEYLPGGDLFDIAEHLGEPGLQREEKVWPIVKSLLRAVFAIHARGVAHGDLSLENVMLRTGPGLQAAVLVDFGMSVTGDLSAVTGVRGKPSYQAPEMHGSDSFDARYSDLFACGVVAYTLALGSYPWSSTRPDACLKFMFAWRHGLAAFMQRRRVPMPTGERTCVEALLSVRFQLLLTTLMSFKPQRRAAALAFSSDNPYDDLVSFCVTEGLYGR